MGTAEDAELQTPRGLLSNVMQQKRHKVDFGIKSQLILNVALQFIKVRKLFRKTEKKEEKYSDK